MSDDARGFPGLQISARLLIGVSTLLLATACSRQADKGGEWVYSETMEGITRTVRTESGSVWGGPGTLVEEVSIGGTDGPPEQLFGYVRSIWATQDRIFIVDSQVPALRVFDTSGVYLETIGGKGGGPGEYERPMSIVVDPADGTIYLRDGRQGRVNTYGADGRSRDTWPLNAGISTSRQMILASDGAVYTPVWANTDGSFDEWRPGMARMTPSGATADTLMVPDTGFEEWDLEAHSPDNNSVSITTVPFSPRELWTMTPMRDVVIAVSDRYRFEIRHPDGRGTVVEKAWDPVPVQREEAAWYRASTQADMRDTEPGWAWRGKDIPAHKPAFDSFFADRDGRIWVRCYGPGERLPGCIVEPDDPSGFATNPCWRDSFWYDVFDATGRFLGRVDIPPGFQDRPPPFVSGDTVIGQVVDDDGIPYVRRYRLITP